MKFKKFFLISILMASLSIVVAFKRNSFDAIRMKHLSTHLTYGRGFMKKEDRLKKLERELANKRAEARRRYFLKYVEPRLVASAILRDFYSGRF
jgi:hypothetical protein